VIKIETRGQNLAQKSTFLEFPQNEHEHRPCRHKPNATCFVSNRHWQQEILQSVHQVKQAKILMLTGQSVHADVVTIR
jgi:hypothetical protein